METMKKLFAVLSAVLFCISLQVHAQDDPGMFHLMDPGSLFYDASSEYDVPDHMTVWKNDTLLLKAVFHADHDGQLTLSCGQDTHAVFLETVSASIGIGSDPGIPHYDVPDRIGDQTHHAVQGETVYVLIEITASQNTGAGLKETSVVLSDGIKEYPLPITYEVIDRVLPEPALTVEFWQYPYASLRWYDMLEGEEPFSRKHQSVLGRQLDAYAQLGMKNITVTVTDEPWGHQVYDQYPSMVKWKHDQDGYLFFDYTEMDQWISLCMEHGVDGYIDCFGILPFTGRWQITEHDGSVTEVSPEIGSYEWTDLWSTFLYSFTDHMEEKGWIDQTYIMIDERPVEEMKAAVGLVQEICGDRLKFHAALAEITEDSFYDVFDRLAVSIASFSGKEDMMRRIIAHRKELGLTTQMYNCSTNYPNVFALSEPDESLWTMEYLAGMGFDGYLRWAMDAWPQDPYASFDFDRFEAGDTMLVYPDEHDSTDPEITQSYRLKMIGQGIRNVTKLQALDSPDILSVMYRGNGKENRYGAVYAKGQSVKALTSLEADRIEQMIRCMEDAASGIQAPDMDLHRSCIAYLGLNPSWDGAYLGLNRCLAMMNAACFAADLVILAVMFMRHAGKIKKMAVCLIALASAACILLSFGSTAVLIDRFTVMILTGTILCAVIALFGGRRQGESKNEA